MNSKHLLSLLQNNFRTVHVIFDTSTGNDFVQAPNSAGQPWNDGFPTTQQVPKQAYVYKCHNDLAAEVGKLAVVKLDDGRLKLVTIVKVDDFADIDLTADHTYKWLVDVVDTDRYDKILEDENKFKRLVAEAERVKLREETLASFKSVLPTEGEAAKLFSEAFAMYGSDGNATNDR